MKQLKQSLWWDDPLGEGNVPIKARGKQMLNLTAAVQVFSETLYGHAHISLFSFYQY